jgi:hypothetical protein
MARAPASASAKMIGKAIPIPGPESPESDEVGEGEATPPRPCELLGAVAVAAAALAAPFASGPGFLRLWAVLGEPFAPPGVPVPEVLAVPEDFPADPDALPPPEALPPPVGVLPPTPGMLSWYWSMPELPLGTWAPAAAGRANASTVRVMTILRARIHTEYTDRPPKD